MKIEKQDMTAVAINLYQGTDYPTYVLFNGYRYPSRNADVNTTYVASVRR